MKEQNPDKSDQRPRMLDDHIYPSRRRDPGYVKERIVRLPWSEKPLKIPGWMIRLAWVAAVLAVVALVIYAAPSGSLSNLFGR